ncbi:hypothetical protein CBL_13064 [Carabus blaptoides fortunei]
MCNKVNVFLYIVCLKIERIPMLPADSKPEIAGYFNELKLKVRPHTSTGAPDTNTTLYLLTESTTTEASPPRLDGLGDVGEYTRTQRLCICMYSCRSSATGGEGEKVRWGNSELTKLSVIFYDPSTTMTARGFDLT